MNTPRQASRLSLLAWALALAMPVAAVAQLQTPDNTTAAVNVEFLQPERYTDARMTGTSSRPGADASVLEAIRTHLQVRAPRFLAAGETLSIRFHDIDLAGDREPTTSPDLHGIRIVRSVFPPRLRFDYRLTSGDGTVIHEATLDLRDLGFDSDRTGLESDPLRYEKRQLDRWLAREIGKR